MPEMWWRQLGGADFERRLGEVAEDRGVRREELLDELAQEARRSEPGTGSVPDRVGAWIRHHAFDLAFVLAPAAALVLTVGAVRSAIEPAEVVVAARPIPEGRVLTSADVRSVVRRRAPGELVAAEAVRRVALRGFEEDDVLTERGLSPEPPAGSSVVSVRLAPGGLVLQSGDRVDLHVVGLGGAEMLDVAGVLVLAAEDGAATVAMDPEDLRRGAPLLVKGQAVASYGPDRGEREERRAGEGE